MCRSVCYFVFVLLILFSCKSKEKSPADQGLQITQLDSADRHSVEHALDGLQASEGLDVTLFASEPMLQNPTNIDIDHRGRVYVTEGYNYRPQISGVSTKFEGDRIVILEDTTGDGKADISKVFYQGPEINAPLGICVLGNEVIISQSPSIWKFTDTDGDDKADKKEILFQGIQGEQSDHGVHALTLGPDGKFYFAMGNACKTIYDKNNKIVKTKDGIPIDEAHFKQGLVIRMNPDGSNIEVLGQNFRNNYECALDSYGNIWQTDNDDDGNKGTRFNYIVEYGNYGYRDEITNASWQTFRTNWEDSIPLRHWHQNDPGVIPNVLNLGSGSPCGLTAYESDAIPTLKGTLLHAEALHHVLRSYRPSLDKAGYKATLSEVLKHNEDTWFRPVDVCVAPDGSLMIADWYDPGVGGHYAGDQVKGRIYRVAPKGKPYSWNKLNVNDVNQLIVALASPNLSARSIAQLKLRSIGIEAIPFLQKAFASSDSILKMRAWWILSSLKNNYIDSAIQSKDEQIQVAGLRMARIAGKVQTSSAVDQLIKKESSPQVLRECAVAVSHQDIKDRVINAKKLIDLYQGQDRWMLEAIGIAANGVWDQIIPFWLESNKEFQNITAKEILWRSRSAASLPYLAKFVKDETMNIKDRMHYLRSFDFIEAPDKNLILIKILASIKDSTIASLLVRSLEVVTTKKDKLSVSIVKEWMDKSNDANFLDLQEKFNLSDESMRMDSILLTAKDPSLRNRAAKWIIKSGKLTNIKSLFSKSGENQKLNLISAIGNIGSAETLDLLSSLTNQKTNSEPIIREAYKQLGHSWGGEEYVIKMATLDKIPAQYLSLAMDGPSHAWRIPIRNKAAEFLKQPDMATPSINVHNILEGSGNIENGKAVFIKTCSTCHRIGDQGMAFGPSLDEIGSKYGKDGILTSILEPSKSINNGYEGIQIITKDGGVYVGIKSNETTDRVVLSNQGGTTQSIEKKTIKETIKINQSLMTPGLANTLNETELIDLIEFLSNLKKK